MLTGASVAARELRAPRRDRARAGRLELERLLIEEMRERDVDGVVYATRTARTVHLPEGLRGSAGVLLNCVDPERARSPRSSPTTRAGAGRRPPTLLAARGRATCGWWVRTRRPRRLAGPRRMAGIREPSSGARGLDVGGVVPCDWSVTEGFATTPRRWLAERRARRWPDLHERPDRDGRLPGARRGRAARARRHQRRLVRRLRARRLAAPGAHVVELPFPELGALRRPSVSWTSTTTAARVSVPHGRPGTVGPYAAD